MTKHYVLRTTDRRQYDHCKKTRQTDKQHCPIRCCSFKTERKEHMKNLDVFTWVLTTRFVAENVLRTYLYTTCV
jgi:hypothetical protein